MNATEVSRRTQQQDIITGTVILTKSTLPDYQYIVSFLERITPQPLVLGSSITRKVQMTKEEQENYDHSDPNFVRLRACIRDDRYRAVRRLFSDAGLLKTAIESTQFNVGWGHFSNHIYQHLRPGQVICRLPGGEYIADKDKMQNMLENYGRLRQNQLYFVPKTYILPRDLEQYLVDRERVSEDQYFIYKPAFNGEALGIVMLSKNDDVPNVNNPAVIQEYITNPLLIKGYKFDLRVYVMITSVCPLICYVYEDGLARFAATQFELPNEDNKADKTVHLTNYAVNKKSDNFHAQNENDEESPSKWTYVQLMNYLDQHRDCFVQNDSSVTVNAGQPGNGEVKRRLQLAIEDVILQTVIACEPAFYVNTQQVDLLHTYPRRCMQLFGFDVLLLDNGHPIVIEVNKRPAMGTEVQLDCFLKYELLSNKMQLFGVPAIFNDQNIPIVPQIYDNMDQKRAEETIYEQTFSHELPAIRALNTVKFGLLQENKFTPLEKRAILQITDENSRRGKFHMIFPTPNAVMLQHFVRRRYLNEFCCAWLENQQRKPVADSQLEGSLIGGQSLPSIFK